MGGLREIEYGTYPGRSRRGRDDQDGAGDAPWGDAGDPARRRAFLPSGLGQRCGVGVDRGSGLAGQRASAPSGRVLVWNQRHQRACDLGAGPGDEHLDVAEEPGHSATSSGRLSVLPWVISGKSAEALTAQAGRLSAHLLANPRLDPVDLGYSLARRSVFEHRAVVVGADRQALMTGLTGVAGGEPGPGAVIGRAGSVGKTVVVFPGQGSQSIGMGRELYDQLPVFAEAFDAVADELDRHLRLPLRQVVWGADSGLLDRTEFAQPALFAVEVALFAVLRNWGVEPGLCDWSFGGGVFGGVCGRGLDAG